MSSLSRIALGTAQPNVDVAPLSWALLEVLRRHNQHPQSFLSAARLCPLHAARCITDKSQRHLDSWLMSRLTCREIFANGAIASKISLVEGQYTAGIQAGQRANLTTLCDWLDLPAIVAIDVRHVAPCLLPSVPPSLAGLILLGVRDAAEACRWRTSLEALYGAPVLGYLNASCTDNMVNLSRDLTCREVANLLALQLESSLQLDRLLKIAHATPPIPPGSRLFARTDGDDTISVAVAFDEAFGSYFADTLDLLEARGARICDFSPLRDEALPWGTDVVYIAGGPCERHAEALSKNHCFKQSLRNFVAQGGRVYAEGSGLAYLCDRLIDRDGAQHAMVGLLPAVAKANSPTIAPEPTEITFAHDTWLGTRGTIIRGYRDDSWQILPEPDLTSFASEAARGWDLVGNARVLGCGLQVDFAGQPHLVSSFFRPRRGALVGSH